MSLACQPTLLVFGWSISPICDHGGPLSEPSHGKIAYVMSLACQPTLLVSGWSNLTVTMGAPLRAPKKADMSWCKKRHLEKYRWRGNSNFPQ